MTKQTKQKNKAPTPTTTPQALTLAAIEQNLEAARFDFVQGGRSRRLYGRWIDKGITLRQFERAVQSISDDCSMDPTPDSIDQTLRAWHKRPTGREPIAL